MEVIGVIHVPFAALQAAPKSFQLRHHFSRSLDQRHPPCILGVVGKPCVRFILHFLNYTSVHELSSTLMSGHHRRVPLHARSVLVPNAINRKPVRHWLLVKLCIMPPGKYHGILFQNPGNSILTLADVRTLHLDLVTFPDGEILWHVLCNYHHNRVNEARL